MFLKSISSFTSYLLSRSNKDNFWNIYYINVVACLNSCSILFRSRIFLFVFYSLYWKLLNIFNKSIRFYCSQLIYFLIYSIKFVILPKSLSFLVSFLFLSGRLMNISLELLFPDVFREFSLGTISYVGMSVLLLSYAYSSNYGGYYCSKKVHVGSKFL
jgi:hypothetical protein